MKLFEVLRFSRLQTTVLWLSLNLLQTGTATVSGCVGGGASDVVFLLDSSYSVWLPDFRRQLTFVQEVIEMLPIGQNNTRVAIVTYADYPLLQFHLDQYSTKPDLRAAIEGIRQRGGFQATSGDAIKFIRSNVFQIGMRSRPLGTDVTRVVVVITNGQTDNLTATAIEAELAKKEGVRMIVVVVGKDVDRGELKDVGSPPTEEHTFVIDNFADLAGIRDLVATKTCTADESARSTKIFAASTTAAELQNRSEASFSKEISATPQNSNNVSLFKAIFKTERFQATASNKSTYIKTTLSKLASNGIDFISTTATTAFLPSKATHPKSAYIKPAAVRAGSSRAATSRAGSSRTNSSRTNSSRTNSSRATSSGANSSMAGSSREDSSRAGSSRAASSRPATTTAPSGVGTTSAVSSTTTHEARSVTAGSLFSETAVLPTEIVNLPPATGITGAKGSWKELSMAIAITDGGVQTENDETAASVQPITVSLSHGASDLQRGRDRADNLLKTTSGGLETSCGLGLLDRILIGKSGSVAPKKDGETADEKGKDEEQDRSTNVGDNGIDSRAQIQQNELAKTSISRGSSTTSTPVALTQVTPDTDDAGAKMIVEATSTKSTRGALMTMGTATTKSSVIGDSRDRMEVISSEYGKEGRLPVLVNKKEASDHDESETAEHGRERSGRSKYEPEYETKNFWRLTDRGKLIQYRLIPPDVYESETQASHRATPRLQSNPRRRVVSRSEGIQSSTTVGDHQEQARGHLGSTDEGIRENHSRATLSVNPSYRSRPNTRTNGRREGHPRGTDTRGGVIRSRQKEALERQSSRDRPHTHKPQSTASGYWRLNDSGKLVWMDNPPTKNNLPSQSNTTGNPNTKSPRAQRKRTSISPRSWHTRGHLKVNGADHQASNSAAHPMLTTDNPMAQRTSLPTTMTDAAKNVHEEMAGSTRSSSKPPGAEIDSHNPKHGYWKYDRSGRNSVWVIYTRSNDSTNTADSTTDAQASTRAGVVPTPGTRGPSLFDSDGLSYGYWMRENGKLVWYEYQSPGVYRKIIDTDPLEAPNKIRIEMPPGMVPGCAGCNPTDSQIRINRPVKVNQSSSSEEIVIIKARDMTEKVTTNRTRAIALGNGNLDPSKTVGNSRQSFSEGSNDNSNSSQLKTSANSSMEEISTLRERTENKLSLVHRYNRTVLTTSDHSSRNLSIQSPQLIPLVRGKNDAGNGKSNMTYENYYSLWIRGHNKRGMDRERSPRTNSTPGVQQSVEENHRTSSTSATSNPRRDEANWSTKAMSSNSSPSPNRRKTISRNSNRVICADSEHRKGCVVRKKPSDAKTKKKHAKGCVARSPLDVVFLVDPRARDTPYTRHLWQLAYEVVSQVRMDDNRIRVRFYPELEVVRATTANNRSAEYGSVQTVIQKVAQKPVPELLRAASRLLQAKSDKRVRRIVIYVTDGPSGTPRELDLAAEEVKGGEAAVEMFAVGIGQETDPVELETIAADDSGRLEGGNRLYRVTRPLKSDINAVALKLRKALCGGR